MRIWILAIATVAVLIGVAGGSYWYGGNGADESALVLNRAPAASDGIQVHGHWSLTVTNPDGTVETLHEFENKLAPKYGASFLTALLAGQTSMTRTLNDAPYRIGLNKTPAANTTNSDWYCEEYVEINIALTAGAIVKATMVRDESLGNPLELSGICTVSGIPDTETASVVDVFTQFYPSGSVLYYEPNTGGNTGYSVPWLTQHALDTSVAVQNRQVIGLNVIISFE